MRIELEAIRANSYAVMSRWRDMVNGSGGYGVWASSTSQEGRCQKQWSDASGSYRIDLKYWNTVPGSGTITVRVLSDLANRTVKAANAVIPNGTNIDPVVENRTIWTALEAVEIDTGDWIEVGV